MDNVIFWSVSIGIIFVVIANLGEAFFNYLDSTPYGKRQALESDIAMIARHVNYHITQADLTKIPETWSELRDTNIDFDRLKNSYNFYYDNLEAIVEIRDGKPYEFSRYGIKPIDELVQLLRQRHSL